MHKEITELLGTLIFVLLGAGAVSIAGNIGTLGVALAIGLSWMVAAYSTGADLNPAVTFGKLVAGATDIKDCIRLIIAQLAGATGAIYIIGLLGGEPGASVFSEGGETTAFLMQAIGACLFVLLVARVAANKTLAGLSGLITGLGLALIVIVAGTAVNPAQSVGAAVFAGGTALEQVWLFVVAPAVGAVVAAMIVSNGLLDAPKAKKGGKKK